MGPVYNLTLILRLDQLVSTSWSKGKMSVRLYTGPTKQVFCLYLRIILDNKSFWMYCSLNHSFWRLKKSSTSCPNWGGKYFCSLSQFRPLSPSTTSLLPIMRAWRVWSRIEVLVDKWKTTVRRCLYIDLLLLLLVFGQARLLSRHRGETTEKNLKVYSKYSIFLLFVEGNHILIMIMRRHSTL